MVCERRAELFSSVFWILLSLVGHTRHPVLQENSSKGERGPLLPWVFDFFYHILANAMIFWRKVNGFVRWIYLIFLDMFQSNSTLMIILSKYNFPFSFKWWGNFLTVISRMTVSIDFNFACVKVNVQVHMEYLHWSEQLGRQLLEPSSFHILFSMVDKNFAADNH